MEPTNIKISSLSVGDVFWWDGPPPVSRFLILSVSTDETRNRIYMKLCALPRNKIFSCFYELEGPDSYFRQACALRVNDAKDDVHETTDTGTENP